MRVHVFRDNGTASRALAESDPFLLAQWGTDYRASLALPITRNGSKPWQKTYCIVTTRYIRRGWPGATSSLAHCRNPSPVTGDPILIQVLLGE